MSLFVLNQCLPLGSLNQKLSIICSEVIVESTYAITLPTDLSAALYSEGLLGEESRIGCINGTS